MPGKTQDPEIRDAATPVIRRPQTPVRRLVEKGVSFEVAGYRYLVTEVRTRGRFNMKLVGPVPR
ncbi:MAG: hypothetical protein ABIJ95_13045 [Pseudomonadota bacterium]